MTSSHRTVRAASLALLLLPAGARGGDCPPDMQAIPGGRFRLGDGSAEADVRPFCLDRTEVTVAAFAACVRAGRCKDEKLRCGTAATYGDPEKQDHPVNCVDWFDAEAFCRSRARRLPTEAEWEWAARGEARARTYPWGESPPADRACWDGPGNALGKGNRSATCPVAFHPGADSPDGVSDLGGNVREWTSTPYERFRVLRGGSWGDSLPEFLAARFRGMNAPDERMELLGFRCAAGRSGPATTVARAQEPDATQPRSAAAAPRATSHPAAPVRIVVPLRIVLPAR